MSKKQNFIDEVQKMIKDLDYEWENEGAKEYWIALTSNKESEKPLFTENGKKILLFMQENSSQVSFKAKEIGEGIMITSRAASGAIRKLVNDGYVEKIGQDPVIYSLTEKGKNIKEI